MGITDCVCSSKCRRGDTFFPKSEDGTLLYDHIDYKETWRAMEKLVEKGLVRAIGLSNFNSRQIDDVITIATIKPAVLQVRRPRGAAGCSCKSSVCCGSTIQYRTSAIQVSSLTSFMLFV